MCAAGRNLDLAAGGVADRNGSRSAPAVDEVLAHELITRAEMRAAGQFDARRKAGGRNVGAAGCDLLDGRFARAHRIEPQRHTQALGEPARKVVGRALGTVAAQEIGVRAVTRDHAQLAVREDPVEQWRRLRACGEQQGVSSARRTFKCCPCGAGVRRPALCPSRQRGARVVHAVGLL